MKDIIWKIYHYKQIGLIFHSLAATLKNELKGCESVLDLGCGSNSLIKYCNIKYSVGVEAHLPYIYESKKTKIHNKYIVGDLTKLNFKPKSFDAVILIDVLEHLNKDQGNLILKKAEIWAKKKIIVNTPNGFLPAFDSTNHYQTHLSGWTIEEMQKKGYKAYGMAGLKILRKKEAPDNVKNECFVTMRFKPGSLWFLVAGLSQFFTYHFPQLAFEVLYIKNLDEKK